MSIYSTNRSGNMLIGNGPITETYAGIDAGSIMCDTETNTMAMFEAILYSDFHELEGRKSGVLTEAEAKKSNIASIKNFGEKMLASLQKFAAKIKSWFKEIAEKIHAFASSDGNELYGKVNAALKKYPGWKGSVEFTYYDLDAGVFEIPDSIVSDFDVIVNNPHNQTPKNVISKYLAMSDSGKVSPSNYAKKALDAAKGTKTINAGNVNEYAKAISDGRQHVKAIKEEQKDIEGKINEIAKKIRKACQGNMVNIGALNAMTSAFQTVTTTIAKAHIAATKANMTHTRLALGKALNSIRKESKGLQEYAIIDAYTEMNFAFSGAHEISEETRSYVESVFCD